MARFKLLLLLIVLIVFAGFVSATPSKVMAPPQDCCFQYDDGSRFYPNMTYEERENAFNTMPKDITCCDGLVNREECRSCYVARDSSLSYNKSRNFINGLIILIPIILSVLLILLLLTNSVFFIVKKKGFLSKKWTIISNILMFFFLFLAVALFVLRPRFL
ncbi:MAG: hypothetical protein ACP5N2_01495 [Candidatus Nanoarchaeia archaeon]